MSSQGATPFSDVPNLMSPRVVFEALGARLSLRLKDAKSPMLPILAAQDDLNPERIARGIIAAAEGSRVVPQVQLVVAPGGHFAIMKGGEGFETNIKAQIAFLGLLL
ncbi:hypothetical protein C8R44DRAFT_863506 [Mycena epipterygia]|nr:hypothetical protein C8R44DRAFT_863506 [Mycena epipterygia]